MKYNKRKVVRKPAQESVEQLEKRLLKRMDKLYPWFLHYEKLEHSAWDSGSGYEKKRARYRAKKHVISVKYHRLQWRLVWLEEK